MGEISDIGLHGALVIDAVVMFGSVTKGLRAPLVTWPRVK